MTDRVWQVPQEQFVAAWNGSENLGEASARLKEIAGGHIPGWALMQRAMELRKNGIGLKVLRRTVPLHA